MVYVKTERYPPLVGALRPNGSTGCVRIVRAEDPDANAVQRFSNNIATSFENNTRHHRLLSRNEKIAVYRIGVVLPHAGAGARVVAEGVGSA